MRCPSSPSSGSAVARRPVGAPASRALQNLLCCAAILAVASAVATDADAYVLMPAGLPQEVTVSAEEARRGIGKAVLINPLGPLLGLVVDIAGIDAALLHIRYHQALSERVGLTAVPVYGHAHFLFDFRFIGAKGGPRISLTGSRLEGWHLLPMVLMGWAWTTNYHGKILASAPMVGGGLSAGYTWCWSGFVLELGGGLYTSTYLDATDLGAPEPLLGIKPEINLSLGYGW